MTQRHGFKLALAFLAAALCSVSHAEIPHLRKQGTATQLIVEDKPFLILGGELGNSTASSLEYMQPYWSKLNELHLNTVLLPVSWEQIEPIEGRFDFSLVDGLLRDARAAKLKLIVLWFGSWKNSMSTYVPPWVKRDQVRFPRAQVANGEGQEILSAFAENNWKADAKAFNALMSHLRAVDAKHQTVVMVQVENEIGMLPTAREYGARANELFDSQVPTELLIYMQRNRARLVPAFRERWEANGAKANGTWRELFGDDTAAEEVFTAWHYARFTEAVTVEGKRAYPLPMFVNAALNRPGDAPGRYPSGGPLPHLLDVWKAGTPSIDFLAPDVYFENYRELVSQFVRPDNPLFIPEANRAGRAQSGADAFFSIGRFDAIGYSPFAIESISGPGLERFQSAYDVLRQLTPVLLANQGHGRISGVRPPVAFDGTVTATSERITLGDFEFTISFIDPWIPKAQQTIDAHGGLIIQIGPEEFYFAGSGLTITTQPASAGPHLVGIDAAWEGKFVNGEWKPGRLMNGDQTHQGRHIRLEPTEFSIQRVKFYRYR
jgi:beta-galactosidase GanA